MSQHLLRRIGRFLGMESKRRAFRTPVGVVETAEPRVMLSALSIGQREQLLIELINRDRANPNAAVNRHDVPSLNHNVSGEQITAGAKAPLAANQALSVASRWHSDDMLDRDYFSHYAPEPDPHGVEWSDRAREAGYRDPTGDEYNTGENIGWNGTTGTLDRDDAVYQKHRELFQSPVHRRNMLRDFWTEIGSAARFGEFTARGTDGVVRDFNAIMVTTVFGDQGGDADFFLTGVVYTDSASGENNDNFYSLGEAASGGTVTAHGEDGQTYSVNVRGSGGWSLQVPDGTYHVTLDQDGTRYIVENVRVNGANKKVDFELGTATVGDVPRERPDAGLPPEDLFAAASNGRWMVARGGDGRLTPEVVAQWDTSVDWQFLSTGDFNGDGLTDAAGWDPATGDWTIGLSDGQTLSEEVWGRWSPNAGWRQVQIGDFDGDGDDDIAARTRGANWFVAFSDNGSLTTSRRAAWTSKRTWSNITVGDFNRDGADDIAGWLDEKNWYASVDLDQPYDRNRNTGLFAAWDRRFDWQNVVAADFDDDGDVDVAAVIAGTGNLFVSRTGNGPTIANSPFARKALITRWANFADHPATDVVAGQFNAAGGVDVALLRSTGAWSVGIHGGGTRAVYDETEEVGSWSSLPVEDAMAVDINGDGIDEIVSFDSSNGRAHVGDPFAWNPADIDLTAELLAAFGTREWAAFEVGQFDG